MEKFGPGGGGGGGSLTTAIVIVTVFKKDFTIIVIWLSMQFHFPFTLRSQVIMQTIAIHSYHYDLFVILIHNSIFATSSKHLSYLPLKPMDDKKQYTR